MHAIRQRCVGECPIGDDGTQEMKNIRQLIVFDSLHPWSIRSPIPSIKIRGDTDGRSIGDHRSSSVRDEKLDLSQHQRSHTGSRRIRLFVYRQFGTRERRRNSRLSKVWRKHCGMPLADSSSTTFSRLDVLQLVIRWTGVSLLTGDNSVSAEWTRQDKLVRHVCLLASVKC